MAKAMSPAGATVPKPPLWRVVLWQAGVLGVSASVLWCWNPTVAQSMVLGGGVYLIPQSVFAWFVFRGRGVQATGTVVRVFYKGEAVKLTLTAVLFAWVFQSGWADHVGALFLGFVAMMVLGWGLTARLMLKAPGTR